MVFSPASPARSCVWILEEMERRKAARSPMKRQQAHWERSRPMLQTLPSQNSHPPSLGWAPIRSWHCEPERCYEETPLRSWDCFGLSLRSTNCMHSTCRSRRAWTSCQAPLSSAYPSQGVTFLILLLPSSQIHVWLLNAKPLNPTYKSPFPLLLPLNCAYRESVTTAHGYNRSLLLC